jgi:Lrp/AsnC family transcriptional regulator, regulator for asnA, asnC and gidA
VESGLDRRESNLMSPVQLDAIDAALIRALQQDGRRPYTQLAREVGLSEAAVRQRVQRLLEQNTMQIVAVTDPLQLGLRRQAMILIKVAGDTRAAAEAISAFEEVDYLVATAGSVDLLAEVVVSDDEALLDLLNDRIRSVPGVVATESVIYLKLVKQTYQWGAQ